MKKYLALVLALVMVFSLAACGGNGGNAEPAPNPEPETETEAPAPAPEGEESAPKEEEPAPAPEAVNPDDIEDNITSPNGVYEVAFVTDVGSLKDKSFNEGTWNGVKTYAYNNGLSYKYYQPANGDQATDDDRYDAMMSAVTAGAKVVVCAGFLQETALRKAAMDSPDTVFVFIDGYPLNDDDGNVLPNVAGIAFHEEQCGYFAGYAVVKEGFTQLGFTGGGGGTNPACCRYGYGFVQGANQAASEMGVDVNINYSWEYGGSYQASPELQTMCNGWYAQGTEVIFACGGTMCNSVFAAASANDGYVIGVDVDQSSESETVITSAMKGLSEAAQIAIGDYFNGEWDTIGGTGTSLGVAEGSVGLPTDTWSLENFTLDEYNALLESVKDGSLVIDDNYEDNLEQDWSNVTLNIG